MSPWCRTSIIYYEMCEVNIQVADNSQLSTLKVIQQSKKQFLDKLNE